MDAECNPATLRVLRNIGNGFSSQDSFEAMRTEKVEGLTVTGVPPPGFPSLILGYYDYNEDQNYPTTRYYYDGQMMVEDDFTTELSETAQVTVMRYGIGARGIDFLTKRVDAGEENRGFPLYDGHGNMIATLGRSENSPYFGAADLRSYDVWGAGRSGSSTGDPKQRYCANLGHVQDDESGLIYMRARYYEPWTGRFVSEDHGRGGTNWYRYCENNPVGNFDASGNDEEDDTASRFLELLHELATHGIVHLVVAPIAWWILTIPREIAATYLCRLAVMSFNSGYVDMSIAASALRSGNQLIAYTGLSWALSGAAKLVAGFALMQLSLFLWLPTI